LQEDDRSTQHRGTNRLSTQYSVTRSNSWTRSLQIRLLQ